MKATRLLLALTVLAAGACTFNTTDPNNPSAIGTNPSKTEVAAAATGILQSARNQASGWNLITAILGREGYRFDGSEPRYISELLQSPWDPGGFGAGAWLGFYQTIRSANQLLDVVGTSSALTAGEIQATRGFAETIKAHQFMMILMGHSEDSIPYSVDIPFDAPPAPFLTNNAVWDSVAARLDSAAAELTAAGGTAFPFPLPSGFSGFDTPATFLQFNRALKGAVDVYRGSLYCGSSCSTSALTEIAASFIDTSASADLFNGVYFNYSTNPGDLSNPLHQNPQTGENIVHPSVHDSVGIKAPADTDARYLAKVLTLNATRTGGNPARSTNFGWARWPSTDTPIPVIRNEELILLRAEAELAGGNTTGAANDVNYVRMTSGGLDSIAGLSGQSASAILGAILNERKYSRLYEGHRWFDMRRTGRINQLVKDFPADVIHDTYPIPIDEVNARK